MEQLNVLSLVPLTDEARADIESVDRAVRVTTAVGTFDEELRAAWGDHVADGYLRPNTKPSTRQERDDLLAEADVIVAGFPVPVDLVARAPRLRWFHQTPAGASNLQRCDLWGSQVIVTTSRGLGNTLAIAEYVVASFLHFSRDLHRAAAERERGYTDRTAFRPVLLAGKTACVIGVGGIGREVGRLCAALGMDVVGTRRSPSDDLPEGFREVAGTDRLLELAAQSSFVAVCCQWTPETHGIVGREFLAALPDGAVIANVARGEMIDEEALVAGLDRLRGVALDVYVGEFESQPPEALWSHPRVLITPHTSAGADERSSRPLELFRQNLAAFVAGRPLDNVIDWNRGY